MLRGKSFRKLLAFNASIILILGLTTSVSLAQSGLDASTPPKTVEEAIDLALEAANEIKDELVGRISLSRILYAQLKLKDDEGAKTTLELATKAALAEEDDWAKRVSIEKVVDAQLGGGDIVGARKSFDNLVKLFPEDDQRFFQQKEAELLARSGDIEGAIESINSVESPSLKAHILTNIATFQAEQEKPDEARLTLKTVQEIAENSVKYCFRISLTFRIATVQERLRDLAGAKATLERVAKMLEKYEDVSDKCFMLLSMASMQHQLGDVNAVKSNLQEALDLSKELEEEWDKASILGQVSVRQAEIGETDTARITLSSALKRAKMIVKKESDEDECNQQEKQGILDKLARYQAIIGDVEGALKTAAEVQEEFGDTFAYEEIAVAQIRAGDIEGGWNTLKKLDPKHFDQKVSPLCEIALALHKQQTELSP